jgi:hypothetical protein
MNMETARVRVVFGIRPAATEVMGGVDTDR